MKLFYGFIIKAVLLYVTWLVVFYYWGAPKGGFDDQMTFLTGDATVWIMQKVGINANSEWKEHLNEYQKENGVYALWLTIDGKNSVVVGNRCNGLFTIAMYIGFLVAYPGRWLPKMAFIVLGPFLIFFSNVLRVIALALNWVNSPDTFDFNHKYTYTFVVYSIVFLLWMWWINKYAEQPVVANENS
jgi:exosortase/archaeosortase family protein